MKWFIIASALFLAACPSSVEVPADAPVTTKAYALEADWKNVKAFADNYTQLPFCGSVEDIGLACSDAEVVVYIGDITAMVDNNVDLMWAQIRDGVPTSEVQISLNLARAGLRQVCSLTPGCTATGG